MPPGIRREELVYKGDQLLAVVHITVYVVLDHPGGVGVPDEIYRLPYSRQACSQARVVDVFP
jgi:hypothetical protein